MLIAGPGDSWGLIPPPPDGSGRREREQLAGALPGGGGRCQARLFREGCAGPHLHFKGVGSQFPTLGTRIYSGENQVALSELPTRAHPFLTGGGFKQPGS